MESFNENLHHVSTREIKRNDPNARDGQEKPWKVG
jgi:hypothetical protein